MGKREPDEPDRCNAGNCGGDSERVMKVNGKRGHGRRRLVLVTAVILTTSLMLVIFPGCKKEKELTLEEIWDKSSAAQENISSLHMEISIYYQNTKFGNGLIQTYTVDVSGNDLHFQNTVFGQMFSEVILAGGKQYSRVMGAQEWKEEPATITARSATQQVEGFANLPSIASAKELKGVEKSFGKDVYHLSFTIPANQISSLFTRVPVTQLSTSTGCSVDVWVEKGTFYRVRYEALIQNVLIEEKIGTGDVRIVTAITDINQPISINPPV